MRAVAFATFGPAEVLSLCELPRPSPGEGEVLVKVAAATVNPTDLMMRSGEQAAAVSGLSAPFIPGMELAGHVEELGPGVSALERGQRVMAIVNPRRAQGGAQAEYVRVPRDSVVVLPDSVDLVEAATVPMNGLTALIALELLALVPGQSLLVTGAAGAVGGYVLQLSQGSGLQVLADANEADRELVRHLGATRIVPRGAALAPAVRSQFPRGVDGLVDGALLGDAAAALVREGGAFAALRSASVPADPRVRSFFVGVMGHAHRNDALRKLVQYLAERRLTPRVATQLPAAKAADAHRLVERGGLRGRVVLTF